MNLLRNSLLSLFFVVGAMSAQTVSLSIANTQTSYDVGANVTFSISTTATGLAGMALIQVGSPFSLLSVPAPYSATVTTTPDMIGMTSFQAVAILGPGQAITSNVVTIDVEPTQTPTSISVSPLNPTLTFRGQQDSFTVLGQIGSYTASLGNATQLSIVSSNPQVVQVGTDKSFTALASGTTNLVVTYGSFSATIPVVVAITEAGDLDGNGVIDQDDLNILLSFLNTNDTVPNDGRDLNNDGVISIADANILAGLCAKTCTIPQTITFSSIPGVIQGTAATLSATASSGLAVSFTSSTPDVCTVEANRVSTPHPGTCTIQATQAGGGNYAPATAVPQSFTVTPEFTITANPQNQTVLPGLFVLADLQIQAATNFNGVVAISCSGGPSGSICLGSPLPVRIVNGKGLALVSILVPFTTRNGSYTETLTLTSGSLTDVSTVKFSVKSLF